MLILKMEESIGKWSDPYLIATNRFTPGSTEGKRLFDILTLIYWIIFQTPDFQNQLENKPLLFYATKIAVIFYYINSKLFK